MRSAIEIANWFIEHGHHYCSDLTHLKIQKLMFIAFGAHAANGRGWLFYDPIEAWRYGPVIRSVYVELRPWGKKAVQTPIVDIDGSIPRVSDCSAIDTITTIAKDFCHMSASELVNWTHSDGGPWADVYESEFIGKRTNGLREIPKQSIRNYFEFLTRERGPKEITC